MHTITSYANAVHRHQVISLWETVFGYDTAHSTPSLAIDKKLQVNDDLFFVALVQAKVVGTVLAGYDGHRGWLYSVAVHPAHRKEGLGSALIRCAEQALIQRGCMKINLQIINGNESVSAFYASLGYAIEPRVSMGKRIPQNIPGHVEVDRITALPPTPTTLPPPPPPAGEGRGGETMGGG
jgi:ribosomal protein S18 acetylase RimI-like enzyme